ncbi:V-type H+-transporting ATPase subunit F [Pancytospora epiphaga]|nr:V-type H+-transporting ATPase subunit F [Pancytospora epiphaga]
MSDYSKILVIADKETIMGFEIAGLVNDPAMPTLIEIQRNSTEIELSDLLEKQVRRKDLAIIFICDFASTKIKKQLEKYNTSLPSIMIIPSKHINL